MSMIYMDKSEAVAVEVTVGNAVTDAYLLPLKRMGASTAGKFTAAGTMSDRVQYLTQAAGASAFHLLPVVSTATSVIFGALMQFADISSSALPASAWVFMGCNRTADNATVIPASAGLLLNPDGSIKLGSGTATAAGTIAPLTYYYMELVINRTSGAAELFINDVSACTGTLTLAGSNITNVGFALTNAARMWIDDFYCLDTDGTSFNARLGPISVAYAPLLANTHADFSVNGGAASNLAAVNKRDLTTVTSVTSPTTNNKNDMYTLDTTALATKFAGKSILGVLEILNCRNTALGTRHLTVAANDGSHTKQAFSFIPPSSYGPSPQSVWPLAMDGAAWDWTKLAATNFGYEVQA
jgi:hypothetical protein